MTTSCEDIIAAKKASPNGELLTIDFKKVKKHVSGSNTVHYFNVAFTGVDKATRPFRLKLSNQMISTGIKEPKPREELPRTIAFKKTGIIDLDRTKYSDKQRALIVKNNDTLMEALEIIHTEWLRLSEVIKTNEKKFGYKLGWNDIEIDGKTIRTIKVHKFMQTDAKSKEDESKKIKLEKPICRFKFNTLQNSSGKDHTGKEKYYGPKLIRRKHYGKIVNTVFDAKKGIARVPAMITEKIGGKTVLKPLTFSNAYKFVTSYSVVTGEVDLSTACSSSQGLSYKATVQEVFVMKHPLVVNTVLDAKAANEMNFFDTGEEDEVVEEKEIDEVQELLDAVNIDEEEADPDNSDLDIHDKAGSSDEDVTAVDCDEDEDPEPIEIKRNPEPPKKSKKSSKKSSSKSSKKSSKKSRKSKSSK